MKIKRVGGKESIMKEQIDESKDSWRKGKYYEEVDRGK